MQNYKKYENFEVYNKQSKEYVTMLIKEEMKQVPSSDAIIVGGFGKGGALATVAGYIIHIFSNQ